MSRSFMPAPSSLLRLLPFVIACLGCDRAAPRAVAASPSPTVTSISEPAPPAPAPPPPPPPEPAVLTAAEPFVDLPVEGHGAAVVSLPRGARDKRPVVIATHGNYDRPEWQCEVWREIV